MRNRVEHVFLVRFWREAGPDAAWRGCLDHVPTGARRYFTSPADMTAYLEERLAQAPLSSEPADEGESAPRPH